jgi:hypothetical protein
MVWLLGVGAVVAVGAWMANRHPRFNPSGKHVEATTAGAPASSPIVLAPTAVRSGTSITTPDGAFTIRVDRVTGRTVKLTVSAEAGDVYRFDKAEVGRRLVVPAPDATYYVDLASVRGNVVHLGMSRNN